MKSGVTVPWSSPVTNFLLLGIFSLRNKGTQSTNSEVRPCCPSAASRPILIEVSLSLQLALMETLDMYSEQPPLQSSGDAPGLHTCHWGSAKHVDIHA